MENYNRMRFRKQYKDNNCGQIALSVITGESLKEIIKLVGHNSSTKTKTLIRVLRELKYKCPNRLIKLKQKPVLAIAKLSYPDKSNWHWVVINKDKIYDGLNGNRKGEVNWHPSRRITSYLPITM